MTPWCTMQVAALSRYGDNPLDWPASIAGAPLALDLGPRLDGPLRDAGGLPERRVNVL